MRGALDDAAPLYQDAPEAQEARASAERTVEIFMRETLPQAKDATRALAGELVMTMLSAAGRDFSASPRIPAEIETYSDAIADMFCAYLRSLGHRA